MTRINKPKHWTLHEAVELVQEFEPIARTFGLHVGLTGSTLFDGASNKDVDILVYPHEHGTVRVDVLRAFALRCDLTPLGKRYDASGGFGRAILIMQTKDGRRVDLIAP